MRQFVASAFGEQPIKLYKFLTYGITRYMYWMYSMLSMAFLADVCMKMTKYFGIYISWLLSWFTAIFAEPNEWCECECECAWASYIFPS